MPEGFIVKTAAGANLTIPVDGDEKIPVKNAAGTSLQLVVTP